MNPSSPQPTAITTFILRFWREWSGDAMRWRGRIEHVQGGQRRDFLCLDEMLRFLRQTGVSMAQLTENEVDPEKDGGLL